MSKASVGLVVHIFNRHAVKKEDQPEAAMIASVHKDGSINVGGIDAHGQPFAERNVRLIDGTRDQNDQNGLQARWPGSEPAQPAAAGGQPWKKKRWQPEPAPTPLAEPVQAENKAWSPWKG